MFLALLPALVALAACASLPDQRVVNGNVASPGEFPWIVSLQLDGSHICGAVALGPNHVLTAAHCVDFQGYDASRFTFVCGLHNLQQDIGQRAVARTIVKHESYDSNALGYPNDIAIARVEPGFVEDDRCVFATLPYENKPYSTKLSNIAGWGRLYDGGPVATLLKKAEVNVISNSACGNYYNILGGLIQVIKSCHICVQDHDAVQGACNGDSGGPLTLRDATTGRLKVAGVTSFGRAGCDTSYPSVYTRVGCYLSWIQTKIAQLS